MRVEGIIKGFTRMRFVVLREILGVWWRI